MAETEPIRRVVVVDSPEIAERGSVLFLGARTIYANGSLPDDALDATDAVIVSTDRARIEAFCAAFVAVQCAKVRFWEQDLSGFTERQQVLDAAAGIKTYVPGSAPQSAAPTIPAEPPPADAQTAAESEPTGSPDEPVDAEKALDADVGHTKQAATSTASTHVEQVVDTLQNAPEPPAIELPPLEAYADQTSVKHAPKARKRPRLAAVDGNLARNPENDPDPLPAALSEDALADHFVETQGQNWRYCTEWRYWLNWRGDGWHKDTRDEVADDFRKVTREALQWRDAQSLTADGKRKLNSKSTAWHARDMAAVDRRISILAEELDADPMILGVPGGVVDLTTGKLIDAEPEQYVTKRCSVSPESGPHPLFDRVLARACAGHDDMRDYLLRWFGYMLTGLVTQEAFMFLHGPGGSGKSTLVKCLAEIMGDYALTISMDAFTESKQERHSQEIAKLEGSRLVYASETEEGRRFKESLIQLLTGGDKIVARGMRQNDREFLPTFKILVYANSVPHLKGASEAMRRRIHLIEYAGSLTDEERDATLKARLVNEYPAILHTLIRGCVDFLDCGGLGKPESVTMSVDSYLESEDSFALFLDECVDRDVQAREKSGDVYRRYTQWARNSGEYVLSQKRFVQTLRARGFDSARSSAGRLISGLKLRAAPMDYPPPHQRDD